MKSYGTATINCAQVPRMVPFLVCPLQIEAFPGVNEGGEARGR